MSFKFIDLFCGLGGFHLEAQELGGECVFACEIQKHLQEVYKLNFGITPQGDIFDIHPRDIPPHDFLFAGFPCQPFSKAGSQLGWKDAVRGTVFFKVIEILEYHKPEFVFLENVAHFVRHDDGNTYARVYEALDSLGYSVEHKQYSPHNFGVPQIRERMYLVARLKSKGGLQDFVWPSKEHLSTDISSILDHNPPEARLIPKYVEECIETWNEFLELIPSDAKLPSFPIWPHEFGATYPYDKGSLRDMDIAELKTFKGTFGCDLSNCNIDDIFTNLPNYAIYSENAFPKWKQEFLRGNRNFFIKHREVLESWLPKLEKFPFSLQKFEWNCQGEERNLWKHVIQIRASGVRVKRRTTSPSLVAMTTTQVPIIAWEKRYMTVRECSRLQSMESLEHFPAPTLAFKALGNAVCVKVVKEILLNLKLA